MGGEQSKQKGFTDNEKPLAHEVEVTINGKLFHVSDDVPVDTSLNTFIREHAHLKGTKFMCLEGGCGACIVAVTSVHPFTGKTNIYAVNSCLVPIYACHSWSISTVEDLGTEKVGYNKIIKRLAAGSGSQCGFCSPGMVMNMYSLLEKNPRITAKEVENSLGGNLCRCTGYRAILEAFKTFATDAPAALQTKLTDIEDVMESYKYCNKEKFHVQKRVPTTPINRLEIKLQGGHLWYRPAELIDVFDILEIIGDKTYRYIAGNTGQGVYHIKVEPQIYIDLNGVPELHAVTTTSEGISIGASVSLTEAMDFFYKMANEQSGKYGYLKTLGDHFDLIANVPIRNTGTMGGNLFLKHGNHDFRSDVFNLLEMVNAKLEIAASNGETKSVDMIEFLKTDMNKKLIVNVLFSGLEHNQYHTRAYKIMPRAQNALTIVSAGFLFKMDKKFHILEKPNLIFSGIRPNFIHAKKTEKYLTDKDLMDEKTLKEALDTLDAEMNPDYILPDASPEYRKGLALSLFYKFVLSVAPDKVQDKLRSGGSMLERPVSKSKQDFDTDSSLWPMTKPIPKVESVIQCSGEAEYANDFPHMPGQLWGQLVLADRAAAVIIKIDATEALKMDGVVAFFKAEDIPGNNDYYPEVMILIKDDRELVFTEGKTNYAGEPIGVIIAETNSIAIKAADLIKVEYLFQKSVVKDVRKILKSHELKRVIEFPKKIEPKARGDASLEIKDSWDMKPQYHCPIETLSCVAIPKDTELDLYPTTQWPSALQEVVSNVLKIPQSSINIHVRRLGGAYGMKIIKSFHTAAVTALAAHLLHRPVRMVCQMERNMDFVGKRFPIYSDYEVGIDEEGTIQHLKAEIYQDTGYVDNDSLLFFTVDHVQNCYDSSNWGVKCYSVKTDTAGNTFCRSPASTEGVCIIENIMEHIADVTQKDPIQVRMANMKKQEDNKLSKLIEELLKLSDYRKREKHIQDFNKANRWKKRGIAMVPMRYPMPNMGTFHGIVSIFGPDGTVSISHAAVELGQGVNTKVIQVAAHVLGVDLCYIKVKPINVHMIPNAFSTGGCMGSDSACFTVKMACEELNKRLQPVKDELGQRASWVDVCRKALASHINLSASHMASPSEMQQYEINGATALEIEVDILTGQHQTLRVDLLEDTGLSLSPEIDIGQVEGAFVMGMGYYTTEEIIYHRRTGKLLTNRTWNYIPPGAKDIPIDFRVTLKKNSTNANAVLRHKEQQKRRSTFGGGINPKDIENLTSTMFLPTGEPPLCMSCVILFAIRNALKSAREDAGIEERWFKLEHPYTVERIWLGAANDISMYKLKQDPKQERKQNRKPEKKQEQKQDRKQEQKQPEQPKK